MAGIKLERKELMKVIRTMIRFCSRDFEVKASGDDSMSVSILGRGTGESLYPWFGIVVGITGSDTDKGVETEPGTFNGLWPTIDGTPINTTPKPQLPITGTGPEIIVLKPVFTYTVHDGFITTATCISATIEVVTSDPTNLFSDTGNFSFPLYSLMDGAKVSQDERLSISGYVCDNGEGTGTGELRLTR